MHQTSADTYKGSFQKYGRGKKATPIGFLKLYYGQFRMKKRDLPPRGQRN